MNISHILDSNKESLRDRISVFLRVLDIEPDEVTSIIGIQPSEFWHKGDPQRLIKGVHLEHMWGLNSPLYRNGTLEEQIDALIDIVKPHINQFKLLPPVHEVFMYCGFNTEERPSIGLTSEQIKFLAQIDASIDIDVYYHHD